MEKYNEKHERVCAECGAGTKMIFIEFYPGRISKVTKCICVANAQHSIGEKEPERVRWTPVSGVRYAVSHEEKENPWEGATPQSVE